MTIMKIFLSLSERMCLMKAQPVPMSAMVMKSSAPFRLQKGKLSEHQGSLRLTLGVRAYSPCYDFRDFLQKRGTTSLQAPHPTI